MKKDHDSISISEFKAKCLAVLETVRSTGTPIVITRHGKPVAKVVPPVIHDDTSNWMGSLGTRFKIAGDVVSPVGDHTDWEVLGG